MAAKGTPFQIISCFSCISGTGERATERKTHIRLPTCSVLETIHTDHSFSRPTGYVYCRLST